MRSPSAFLPILFMGCINLFPERALGIPLNSSSPTFSPSHHPTLRPNSKQPSSSPSPSPSVLSLPTQKSFLRTHSDQNTSSTPQIIFFIGLMMCLAFVGIIFVWKSQSRDKSGGDDNNDAEAIVDEILQDIQIPIAVASGSGSHEEESYVSDDNDDDIEEDAVSAIDIDSSPSSESSDEDDVESTTTGSVSLMRKLGGEIRVPSTKKGDASVSSVSTVSKFGGISAISMSVSEDVETVWSDDNTMVRDYQSHRGSMRRAKKPSQRHKLSTVESVSLSSGEEDVSLDDVSTSYGDEAASLSLQDTSSYSLESM